MKTVIKYFKSSILQILTTLFSQQFFLEHLESTDVQQVFKRDSHNKKQEFCVSNSLTFLRYMKNYCKVSWKHTLSLYCLNISVDLENVLVYWPTLEKWQESLDQVGKLTDVSKTFDCLSMNCQQVSFVIWVRHTIFRTSTIIHKKGDILLKQKAHIFWHLLMFFFSSECEICSSKII